MPSPCCKLRRIASMDSPRAAPTQSRRLPWIGLVGRRHLVRVSLLSATGCPMASAVAKAIRSRRRRTSPRLAGRRFRTIRPRYNARGAYFNEDCGEVWRVPAAPETMHQPVVSSIPMLLISGSFDTLTALAGAKAAAAQLSNATIISVPGVGHAVSPQSPSPQALVVSFLADPAAPDTSCVGALKPQPFTASP